MQPAPLQINHYGDVDRASDALGRPIGGGCRRVMVITLMRSAFIHRWLNKSATRCAMLFCNSVRAPAACGMPPAYRDETRPEEVVLLASSKLTFRQRPLLRPKNAIRPDAAQSIDTG